MKYFTAYLAPAILINACFAVPTLADETISDPTAFLRQVITEHSKSINKYKGFKVVVHEEREGRIINGIVAYKADLESIYSGSYRWFRRETENFRRGPNNTIVKDSGIDREWYVLNGDYALWYHEGQPMARMWEHDSIDRKQKVARSVLVHFETRDILNFGFGIGDASLGVMLLPDRSVAKVEAKSVGSDKFAIQFCFQDAPVFPACELKLAPQCGFLITEVVMRAPQTSSSEPYGRIVVAPKEVEPGVWFPGTWEKFSYGEPNADGKRAAESVSRNSLVEWKGLQAIAPDQFTWKSVPIPPSAVIWRQSVSGNLEELRVEKGELLRQEIGSGIK